MCCREGGELICVLSVSPLESLCTVLGQTSSLLFQSLASSYSRLCHLTGQHSVSLTAFLHTDRDVKGLVILKHANTFLDMYKEQVHNY